MTATIGDLPPTCRKVGSSCSRDMYSSTVYRASCVIILEGLVWKARPGACEEEPPVAGIGPLSMTTTSVQPSSARW
jgi:hypothetical protein